MGGFYPSPRCSGAEEIKKGAVEMKTLIIYKIDNKAYLTAQNLCWQLRARSISAEILSSPALQTDMAQQFWDMVFVLGGDGTILRTARCFAGTETPILGINFGKIGFLSSIEPHHITIMLEKILQKQYGLEKRLMLDISINRGQNILYQGLALNDAVIRSMVMHAVDIQLYVNGSPYAHYRGDGIICATPTGSTAYSYSAGGPIIDAHLPALVITPISPQLSCSRALVVDAASLLEFTLKSHQTTSISIDGQDEIPLITGDRVEISKSTRTVSFAQIEPVSCINKIMQCRKNAR